MRLGLHAGALACAILLVGCASSTGILPAGPDTYTLSEKYAPIRGGGDEAQRSALIKASEYCSEKGGGFVPAMVGEAGNLGKPYGPTGFRSHLQCLLPHQSLG